MKIKNFIELTIWCSNNNLTLEEFALLYNALK